MAQPVKLSHALYWRYLDGISTEKGIWLNIAVLEEREVASMEDYCVERYRVDAG